MGFRDLPCLSKGAVDELRELPLNSGEHNPEYKGNECRTTKYTLLTFLPKALFEQYRRVANSYFTIVSSPSRSAGLDAHYLIGVWHTQCCTCILDSGFWV